MEKMGYIYMRNVLGNRKWEVQATENRSRQLRQGGTLVRQSGASAQYRQSVTCQNSFLEKAQGKEVFTALKYTKEKTLRIVPSLQYSKDGITRLVKSFKDQCKAFTTTLFPKPPFTNSIN